MVVPPLIIAAIIAAISDIVGDIVDAGKAALDLLVAFFQSLFTLIQSFIQSAPTPMKILIFMFFLLSIGNIFSNFGLGIRYACDSRSTLYETDNIGTAMTLMFKTQFQSLSNTTRNDFIHTNFQKSIPSTDPTKIKCSAQSPRLHFYSIDVLSYKLWMMLLLIFFGAPMVWSYYSRMGALK